MARDARPGMGLLDRLVLLVAWIATCGLVYLLGFYVGKGMQERRLGLEERVVRLPVSSQPPPEGKRPKADPEFGFYDKLMGEHPPERAAPAPAAPGPVHVATVPVPTPPPTLPPARPVPVPAPPPAAAGHPAPSPPAVAAAKAPPPSAAPTVTPSAPAKPAAPAPTAHPADAADATAKPASPATSQAGAHRAAGGWTVLANPTKSRDEADGLVRQLRGRGYDATLVRVVRDGDTWYRVQVGRFTNAEQAGELMRRLREHEGVSHAFVASE